MNTSSAQKINTCMHAPEMWAAMLPAFLHLLQLALLRAGMSAAVTLTTVLAACCMSHQAAGQPGECKYCSKQQLQFEYVCVTNTDRQRHCPGFAVHANRLGHSMSGRQHLSKVVGTSAAFAKQLRATRQLQKECRTKIDVISKNFVHIAHHGCT